MGGAFAAVRFDDPATIKQSSRIPTITGDIMRSRMMLLGVKYCDLTYAN
jgi:hypothetical protein